MGLPFISAEAGPVETAFAFAALGGTLFFLLRVLMVLVGGFADDFDFSADDGSTFDDASVDAAHTEAAFKLISLNTLSAFVMMFGWSGITASVQFKLNLFLSTVIALAVGIFSMYVAAWMYKMAKSLASSGADFALTDTVGQHASVYQRIPKKGVGKIQVVSKGMTHELNARASDEKPIDSFTNVEVLGVVDNETVLVKQIN